MTFQEIVEELRQIVRDWHQEEKVPRSVIARCKELGKKLNALGGMDAMRGAYYEARKSNLCASNLNYFWHGIGDWMM